VDSTAEMAGFFAAHAVWCVSDGGTLTPMLAREKPDGTREMLRLVNETTEDAVAHGQQMLEDNPEGAPRAVLIYDGLLTLEDGKTDALLIDARQYSPEPRSLLMAVPYRNAADPAGFAVYRPTLLLFDGPGQELEPLGEAFFRGADGHEKGSEVWAAHLAENP
jgi:hypothetical protein